MKNNLPPTLPPIEPRRKDRENEKGLVASFHRACEVLLTRGTPVDMVHLVFFRSHSDMLYFYGHKHFTYDQWAYLCDLEKVAMAVSSGLPINLSLQIADEAIQRN